MTEYRDSYHHTLAVDTAALTVPAGGALSVLIVRTGDGWRLPGTFLHEGERLADAVLRSLQVKAGSPASPPGNSRSSTIRIGMTAAGCSPSHTSMLCPRRAWRSTSKSHASFR